MKATYKILGNDVALVEAECIFCGAKHTFRCSMKGLEAWINGEGLIQDVLGDLDANWREMLISGVCPKCWDNMCSEENMAIV